MNQTPLVDQDIHTIKCRKDLKLTIDTQGQTLTYAYEDVSRTINLYSEEAFYLISQQWMVVGWQQKYVYSFAWMGRPVIQLPEDMIRIQEVIYQVQPDVIIETGVAHGGSLVFYASLCKAMGKGHVVGIDIEIRPHNRQAIEAHEMFPLITLIEGSSTDPDTLERVKAQVQPGQKVLVILDSCHTKAHVASELEMYSPLVTPGSYIVATDGVMKDLYDLPGINPDWEWDHPTAAAQEFAAHHPGFEIEEPAFPFNEGPLTERITHWPQAFIKRTS